MNAFNKKLADLAFLEAPGTNGAPEPLPDPLLPVEPFAPEMLPKVLKDFVADVSKRMPSTPPDFVAVSAICGLAGVVGCRVGIKPKQYDDWLIVPNLWGALVGRPSTGKTPASKEALKPLRAIEDRELKLHLDSKREFDAERKLRELQEKEAEARAKKLIKEGKHEEAKLQLLASDEIEPPVLRRIVVKDATVESVGVILSQNPTGLLVERDELTGWLAKMQREDSQEERAFYLEAWNGNGSYAVDRIGRGHIAIPNCCVSILGGIQPSKLYPIVNSAVKGKTDDGLIQRFQLAVWPDEKMKWRWVDESPSKSSMQAYANLFDAMWHLDFKSQGNNSSDIPYLRFAPEAQKLFIEWSTEHHNQIRDGSYADALQSHLLKMEITVASLALLFELISGGRESVGIESTLMALAWSDYLKSHAERTYSAATSNAISGAKLLCSRRKQLPSPFRARDVKRKAWSGLTDSSAVDSAIETLIDHNYLVENLVKPTSGRPTAEYSWNPLLETGEYYG